MFWWHIFRILTNISHVFCNNTAANRGIWWMSWNFIHSLHDEDAPIDIFYFGWNHPLSRWMSKWIMFNFSHFRSKIFYSIIMFNFSNFYLKIFCSIILTGCILKSRFNYQWSSWQEIIYPSVILLPVVLFIPVLLVLILNIPLWDYFNILPVMLYCVSGSFSYWIILDFIQLYCWRVSRFAKSLYL